MSVKTFVCCLFTVRRSKNNLQTFRGLIADRWGVGGVPLGGVQRRRHWGVTVLVVRLWAAAVAPVKGAGQPLIVPGLAAVALAVHRALVPLQAVLVLRRLPLLQRRALAGAGPPGFLGRGYLLRLGGAQQTSHGQHPLNGLFCAGWGRTFSAGRTQDLFTSQVLLKTTSDVTIFRHFLPFEWFVFVPEFLARLVQLYGVPWAVLVRRALLLLVLLGAVWILVRRGWRRRRRWRFMLH